MGEMDTPTGTPTGPDVARRAALEKWLQTRRSGASAPLRIAPTPALALRADPEAEPQPRCPLCHDAGWVVGDASGELVRCACQRSMDELRAYQHALAASNLTKRMRRQTFATFDPARFPDAVATLRAFAARPEGWVALTGQPGTGKTHLLAATANALIAAGRYPLYVVAPDFLAYLKAGMSGSGPSGSGHDGADCEARIQQAITADVLLLDDLGAEYATGWAEEQFYRVLNARYNAEAPTVIATNLWFDALPARVASRLQDRELVRLHIATCDDYRVRERVQREEAAR